MSDRLAALPRHLLAGPGLLAPRHFVHDSRGVLVLGGDGWRPPTAPLAATADTGEAFSAAAPGVACPPGRGLVPPPLAPVQLYRRLVAREIASHSLLQVAPAAFPLSAEY